MPKVQLPVHVGVASLPEARFALVPDAEDSHRVVVLVVTIESHVSGAAA